MRWYNLYNLKNVRNIRGGVLILKETVLRGCVLHFQSCINGTKLPKASHIHSQECFDEEVQKNELIFFLASG